MDPRYRAKHEQKKLQQQQQQQQQHYQQHGQQHDQQQQQHYQQQQQHYQQQQQQSNIDANAIKRKQLAQSLIKERTTLPVYAAREKLLKDIEKHPVVIVVGETGSGKTTQIPQFLNEGGYADGGGMIAITQPRRVAAITVSNRVAQEMGVDLGQEVGYCVRFDDQTSKNTILKYMTDGMLLRELMLDPNMERYSVVILDEAHERTLHTEVLFALVKRCLKQRTDLRIIVMSATLEAEAFQSYFEGSHIVHIPGRRFPVDVMYTLEPQPDYLDAVLVTILQIHLDNPHSPGDILAFVTGQEEIENLEQILNERKRAFKAGTPMLEVCCLYAALPNEEQMRAFAPAAQGSRKVILATNIAESSLTIPGIKYVIDSGVVKARIYNPSIGLEMLQVMPVSKAQARQRCGRAGREGPGFCYRVFPEIEFFGLADSAIPEIKRVNLAGTVLTILAIGIDMASLEFMDKPSHASLANALELLYLLGALNKQRQLTDLGKNMALLPVEPQHAKLLLESQKMECHCEALTVVAAMSVDSLFYVPNSKREEAESAKKKFASLDGDHITLLNAYKAFIGQKKGSKGWCYAHFINFNAMRKVVQVRQQLRQYTYGLGLEESSCGADLTPLRRTLVTGFFQNSARLQPDQRTYKTLRSSKDVYTHPSSVLFRLKPLPSYVIYSELVLTSKLYMRHETVIDAAWLPELAPHFYKSTQQQPQ